MDPKFTVDDAAMQQAVSDASPKPPSQPVSSEASSDETSSGSTPQTTSPTSRERRLLALAEGEITEWWTDIGYPARSFSLTVDNNVALAEWEHDGRNFRAEFEFNKLKLTVEIETALGWQPVADRKAIQAAIQAESDLRDTLIKLAAKWFVAVGITNAPAIQGDLATKTVIWFYRGHKFVATMQDKNINVKLVVDVPNGDPLAIDVTRKADFDRTVASPPRLTPEEIVRLQTPSALLAYSTWAGGSPGVYWELMSSPDQIILQTQIRSNNRLVIWIYQPSTTKLRVLGQVPAGFSDATEIRGHYYAEVATKSDLDKLPIP